MKKAFKGAMKQKINFGFTLAEVLITLGIIGVVATITMPTLIQNYKKQVYVNQLKKTYSTLEQGFQKMLADEGVSRLTDLPYWGEYNSTWDSETATQEFVNNILSKAFNATFNKQPNYVILSGGISYEDGYNNHMQFADGSTILAIASSSPWTRSSAECEQIKSLGGNMCTIAVSHLFIDTNGIKGPNKLGRDIFNFVVTDEGKLYPYEGKDYALFFNQTNLASNYQYWRNRGDCSDNDESQRYACAARIMEENWKMNY